MFNCVVPSGTFSVRPPRSDWILARRTMPVTTMSPSDVSIEKLVPKGMRASRSAEPSSGGRASTRNVTGERLTSRPSVESGSAPARQTWM